MFDDYTIIVWRADNPTWALAPCNTISLHIFSRPKMIFPQGLLRLGSWLPLSLSLSVSLSLSLSLHNQSIKEINGCWQWVGRSLDWESDVLGFNHICTVPSWWPNWSPFLSLGLSLFCKIGDWARRVLLKIISTNTKNHQHIVVIQEILTEQTLSSFYSWSVRVQRVAPAKPRFQHILPPKSLAQPLHSASVHDYSKF